MRQPRLDVGPGRLVGRRLDPGAQQRHVATPIHPGQRAGAHDRVFHHLGIPPANTSVSARRSLSRSLRQPIRKSSSSADCSPRTCVAWQASLYIDTHQSAYSSRNRDALEKARSAQLAPVATKAAWMALLAESGRRRFPRRPPTNPLHPDKAPARSGWRGGRPPGGGDECGRGDRRDRPPHPHPAIGLQRGQQRIHRRKAKVRIRRQPAQQNLAHPGWHAGLGARRSYRAGGHAGHQRHERVALERSLAVEGFVDRDAEAELVGARVGRPHRELLRRHVRRGAQHRSGLRQLQRQVSARTKPERSPRAIFRAASSGRGRGRALPRIPRRRSRPPAR